MALRLLHGTLVCTIHSAADLKNEFRLTGSAPKFIRKMVESVEGAVSLGRGPSRLYATIDLEKVRVGRTRMIEMEPVNPVWNEIFRIYCAHFVANVVISVKDDDTVGSHVLGRARIPVKNVLSGRIVEDWYELYHDAGSRLKGVGRIKVSVQFFDRTQDPFWGTGMRGESFPGVQFTYFPQRKGCKVSLYQDAHMRNGFLPNIFLANNQLYQVSRCWEDVYQAISGAQHFIYIAGWSVFTQITLVRDPERYFPGSGHGVALGELLKRKADEGVRVLLLVWDDRTSNFIKRDGLMGTHDEETFTYFRNTNVRCLLCPRNPDDALSVAQGMQLSTMFTHHQKLVCVDYPAGNEMLRKLVSFVGGLDLCNGRYDDQRHSLFRTSQQEHALDFYQGCFAAAKPSQGGPREPWHDIHARVEGPVAWDVLENFEQRWKKQGVAHFLLDIASNRAFIPRAEECPENDPESWNVQLFRSIDGGAAFGFPDKPAMAAQMGLVSGKDKVLDRSIQDAYIHAIRRAKRFIYIENQYFLGSCHLWDSMQDVGCLHLVPIELTLKIVSKIEAGERFSVYVVIPMWPEGLPESNQVQAILDWQRRTMEMMFKQIAHALHATGRTQESPTDYLSFFCLGNREAMKGIENQPEVRPEAGSNYSLAQQNRRFMIYVHSKMMIVDDEYIIVGSANINQRSMDGGRDSEIAIGAYQPFHTESHGLPCGQIHGFRMSLWYEHLGRLDNVFLKPWSLECMQKINEVAKDLWEKFVAEEIKDLPGHLLTYPVVVVSDGTVLELPGQSLFPDTKASVLGSKSTVFPPILTT
eukprot:c28674_g1_i1 orf=191-2614(+)